jgi:hypothetical protein
MSTTRTIDASCPACRVSQRVLIAESANAMRHPRWRDQVRDGTFMSFVCTGCGDRFTVEHELLFTDLPKGVFIGVFPRAARVEADRHAAILAAVFARTAGEARLPGIRCRAVFGYAELREKLVCWDAALDDRVLEALKLALFTQNAEWTANGSRGLELVEVGDDGALVFLHLGVATPGGAPVATRVDRTLYDHTAATEPEWAPLLRPLSETPWVNLARCVSRLSA